MSTTATTTTKKRKKKPSTCVFAVVPGQLIWTSKLPSTASPWALIWFLPRVCPEQESFSACFQSGSITMHWTTFYLLLTELLADSKVNMYILFSKLKKVIRKKLLIGLSKTKMIFWGSCQEKAPLSEALTWAKLKQKVTFAADLRGRRRKANTHNSTTVFVIL